MTTIDYKALAKRVELYAELGVEGCDFWRTDLRTVVSLLEGMAEAEPAARIYTDAELVHRDPRWGRVCWIVPECEIDGGALLYLHPAPQPQPERHCIGNDPNCPCQDGDPCHYRDHGDTKAMPIPQPQPVSDPRPCTCHPDDNPPAPCAQQYALNECRAAQPERQPASEPRPARLFIDGEWNSYGGELISIALAAEDGREFYAVLGCDNPEPWVAENVIPKLGVPRDESIESAQVRLKLFLMQFSAVHIVADWPEDIERFCRLLITGPGTRIDTPPLTMEVVRIDAPSENPHNALADARGLRAALAAKE